MLAPHADYLVINVSSPNTPGLRDLQAVERLGPLLVARCARRSMRLRPTRRVPLLVKIAPDLADGDIDAVADLALALGLDGIVAVNTTLVARRALRPRRPRSSAAAPAGVSGAPLKARALEVLRRLRARAGDRLLLISVGGIETADDVWDRLRAGATLVQLYTALVYEGPGLPSRLNRELAARLRSAGYTGLPGAGSRGAVGIRPVTPAFIRRAWSFKSPQKRPFSAARLGCREN